MKRSELFVSATAQRYLIDYLNPRFKSIPCTAQSISQIIFNKKPNRLTEHFEGLDDHVAHDEVGIRLEDVADGFEEPAVSWNQSVKTWA